jgi:hypothetical protein
MSAVTPQFPWRRSSASSLASFRCTDNQGELCVSAAENHERPSDASCTPRPVFDANKRRLEGGGQPQFPPSPLGSHTLLPSPQIPSSSKCTPAPSSVCIFLRWISSFDAHCDRQVPLIPLGRRNPVSFPEKIIDLSWYPSRRAHGTPPSRSHNSNLSHPSLLRA